MPMHEIGEALPTAPGWNTGAGTSRHLAPTNGNHHRSLTGIPPMPELSPDTRAALDGFAYRHPDTMEPWEYVTPAVKQELAPLRPIVEQRCRPATYDDWYAFLLPVAVSTANAPAAGKPFQMTVAATAQFMGDVPLCALHEGWQECGRQEFFPKPAALLSILAPYMRKAEAQRMAVYRILAAKAQEPTGRRIPTDEERLAVRAKVQALQAEMLEREHQARMARAKERGATVFPASRAISEGARMARLEGRPMTEREAEIEHDMHFQELLEMQIGNMRSRLTRNPNDAEARTSLRQMRERLSGLVRKYQVEEQD